jgi:hypothetical protein
MTSLTDIHVVVILLCNVSVLIGGKKNTDDPALPTPPLTLFCASPS